MKKDFLYSFTLVLGVGIIILLLIGWIGPTFAPKSPEKDPSTLWNVYEDQDNGVTCYIYDEKSISCLSNQSLTQTPEEAVANLWLSLKTNQ